MTSSSISREHSARGRKEESENEEEEEEEEEDDDEIEEEEEEEEEEEAEEGTKGRIVGKTKATRMKVKANVIS